MVAFGDVYDALRSIRPYSGAVPPGRDRSLERALAARGLTAAWPLVRIEVVVQRVAYVLLVAALVSAGGSTPFAHVNITQNHHVQEKLN